MSRIWTEIADPKKHADYMSNGHTGGLPVKQPRDNLLRPLVLLVEVCGFTFQFHSKEQLDQAIEFFSCTVHESNRGNWNGIEHYWQVWYERLPKGLSGGTSRIRVLAALQRAAEIKGKVIRPTVREISV